MGFIYISIVDNLNLDKLEIDIAGIATDNLKLTRVDTISPQRCNFDGNLYLEGKIVVLCNLIVTLRNSNNLNILCVLCKTVQCPRFFFIINWPATNSLRPTFVDHHISEMNLIIEKKLTLTQPTASTCQWLACYHRGGATQWATSSLCQTVELLSNHTPSVVSQCYYMGCQRP